MDLFMLTKESYQLKKMCIVIFLYLHEMVDHIESILNIGD